MYTLYKILYNLFDWPTRPHSQLVVVGIANTMDLPDRLGDKIKSRATHEPINFKSYSRGQVETIIKSRLKEFVNVFEESAITIAAAKVSAYSGDIRLALQICSRAADLRRSKTLLNKEQSSIAVTSASSTSASSASATTSLVSKADVLEVIKQLNESTHVEALHTLSPCQVFVLVALGAEIRFLKKRNRNRK
jgi:origin recognition complex subunit 1